MTPRSRPDLRPALALAPMIGVMVWVMAPRPALPHGLRPAALEVSSQTGEVAWIVPLVNGAPAPMRLRLSSGCARADERVFDSDATRATRFRAECGPEGLTGVVVEGLAEAGAEVVARVDGQVSLLSAEHPALDLSRPRATPAAFVMLGFEHVAFGLDHLLFLLGLAALIRARWRLLLGAATAFALGHSATLAAAALGAIQAPARSTEALIALTVLALAVELARRPGGDSADALCSGRRPSTREARSEAVAEADDPMEADNPTEADEQASVSEQAEGVDLASVSEHPTAGDADGGQARRDRRQARRAGFDLRERPWAFALACGLLHGLGFAGGLLELGLPPEQALGALLGFNVGVEIGQVAALGASIGVGALIARVAPGVAKNTDRSIAYVIGGASAFWVIARVAAIMGWG